MLAQQHKFDVILMDLDMPVMDGFEAAKQIRSNSLNQITQIIALSGFAYDEDIQAIHAAGMNLHIAKPISMKKLRAHFDDLFSSSQTISI